MKNVDLMQRFRQEKKEGNVQSHLQSLSFASDLCHFGSIYTTNHTCLIRIYMKYYCYYDIQIYKILYVYGYKMVYELRMIQDKLVIDILIAKVSTDQCNYYGFDRWEKNFLSAFFNDLQEIHFEFTLLVLSNRS